jgi:exopolysaccharide biosynthesis polyprenyl glycosylphosphotransferase
MSDLASGGGPLLEATTMELGGAGGAAPAAIPASVGRSYDHVSGTRGRRGALVRRALLTADAVALVCAYGAALAIDAAFSSSHGATLPMLPVALLVWLVSARSRGLYVRDQQRPEHSTVDELGIVLQLASTSTWLAFLVTAATGTASPTLAVAFWATSAVFVFIARAVARAAVRRHPDYVQNTLIVGAGDVGQLVARKLGQHREFGLRVVGFVDKDPRELNGGLENLRVLGRPDEIANIVRANDVDRVIVAFSSDRHDVLVPLVRSLRDLSVQVDFVPRLFEAVGRVASVHMVEGLPLLSLQNVRPSRYARRTKRVIDIVLASVILVLTLPLFVWIAWRIKRDSPGPVFFRQTRLGQRQRPFTLLKFRTMRDGTDATPHQDYVRGIMDVKAPPPANRLYKLDRSSDVTRIGAWLRRTSLDELPQLINVIRGEMSLVGPRPCIAYETELFEPHHFDRFLVPAGMTGLWQVAARARSTFKEALDLDAAYAQSWSLSLDAALLARTPLALIRDKATT